MVYNTENTLKITVTPHLLTLFQELLLPPAPQKVVFYFICQLPKDELYRIMSSITLQKGQNTLFHF